MVNYKRVSFESIGLLIKTTKELKLAGTNDETGIRVMKGGVLLLGRIMVAKWIEKV